MALDQAGQPALLRDMPLSRPPIGYRDAGVDIDAADRLVGDYRDLAAKTRIPGVLSGVGGFGALFALRDAPGADALGDPVLVSGTDGVGTKLKVAFATGRHDTIGIDLVAMCVNDVLTSGARPLFFLDYFATGRLDPDVGRRVVAGIAEGCRQAGCALVGGETAELPGMYPDGEYDLAGFAVGVVDRSRIVDGAGCQPGHAIVGVASHGIHANGLSLARKVLLERAGLSFTDPLAPDDPTLVADALLRPTAIYAGVVAALLDGSRPLALAHITGGGIPGNLPRVLPDGLGAELFRDRWTVPRIFGRIAELGPMEPQEMDRTFNMGLGLLAVVEDPAAAVAVIERAGAEAAVVGHVVPWAEGAPRVVYR